jgi:3-hydroxybutyryl-CoA dehydrogenase
MICFDIIIFLQKQIAFFPLTYSLFLRINFFMTIAIKANEEQKAEFLSKKIPSNMDLIWFDTEFPEADAYFDLSFDEINLLDNIFIKDKIVFANAVTATCSVLPINYVRINAWSGFLKRDILEIAFTHLNEEKVMSILNKLEWKFQQTPDEPGMIAVRIISMIVNEAYFGLGDKISTKAEIDIAMKLGTNYPFGPFEWSEKIGLKKIYLLLAKLAETSARCAIAPKLAEEISEQKNT